MQNGEGMLLVQVQHLVVRYNGRRSGHEALNITARFLNFPPNSSFYIHVASFLVQTNNNHFYNLIRVFINIVEKKERMEFRMFSNHLPEARTFFDTILK